MSPSPSPLSGASDRALARRSALGDHTAFRELFHRYFPDTFAYALRMLDGDDTTAQDACQEAWTKIWLKSDSFRGEAKFRTWVFTIVAREVVDLRRRRRPVFVAPHVLQAALTEHSTDPHAIGTTASAEDTSLDRDLWAALAVALSELPWRQRDAWLLREHQGMSYDEIAQVLATTNATVRGQLHRARRALARRLEPWR